MKSKLAAAPEGTQDKLFSGCRERRRIESRLSGLFARRGYREAITPVVEYFDTIVRAGNPMSQESMLKLIDRGGSILVLRPDITTPIARIVAGKLKNEDFPQRLYYLQDVYRGGASNAGHSLETPQAGIELIGASGARADLEVITAAVQAMAEISAEGFHIELGHAGLFGALAKELEADGDMVEQMRELIEGKNYAALGDILEPFSDRPSYRALKELSTLFGGVEVLEEAAGLTSNESAHRALDYLRHIYDGLGAAGFSNVLFDLGQVSRINYYTGIVFRGYADGASGEVLTGGRYDNLMGGFGKDLPAIGFAIDIDAACRSVEAERWQELTAVIHYSGGALDRALAIMDSMPPGSCELSCCDTVQMSLNLARRKGAGELIIVDLNGEKREMLGEGGDLV